MATACDATTSVRQPLRAFEGAAYLHRTRTSSRNHRASYRIKPTDEPSRTRINTEPRHPTATTNRGSSGDLGGFRAVVLPGQHRGRAPSEPSRTRINTEPRHPTATTNRASCGSRWLQGIPPDPHRSRAPGEPSRTRLHTEPRHPTAATNRGGSGWLSPPGQHGGGAPGEGGRRPPSILSRHGRPPSHYPTLRSGSNG